MADNDNSPDTELRNAQIEVKSLIYEIRTLLEALAHGFKLLLKRPETEGFKREIGILENFVTQIIDALDSYEEPLRIITRWPATDLASR